MKDGVNHYCKTCLKEACDNYRDRNREIIRKKDMEKYYANYEENKKKNRENAKKHKEQRLQYGKIYRFKNKDKCNFYNKQRRALINGSLVKLTNDEWEEIKLFFTNNNNNIICAYCHKELDLVTMDHIIPVIKKGSHSQDNIITACRNCNSSKNSSNMEEWYKKQKYYDEDKLKLIYKYILMAKIKEYIKIKESN
jgi:5-methylcytosine-specific restriction endonuclease McrA